MQGKADKLGLCEGYDGVSETDNTIFERMLFKVAEKFDMSHAHVNLNAAFGRNVIIDSISD